MGFTTFSSVRWIAIALLVSHAPLVFADAVALDQDDVYESFATEYEFESVGQDPIHITDVSGKLKTPEQVIAQAAEIEKSSGDKHVPVFLNEGQEYKLTPEIKKAFKSYGLIVDPVVIPRVVQKRLVWLYDHLFKGVYARPEARDWTVGFTLGAMRTAISAGVYFSAPGVSHELAAKMTAMSGFITFSHTVYADTIENFFWKGIKDKSSKLGKGLFFAKDLGYSLFLVHFMNNLGSGPVISTGQLLTSMGPMMAVASLNGTLRRSVLQGVKKTHLNIAYALLVMPFLYTFQGLESAGVLSTWFHIGYFEVKPSIIAAFTIYASLIGTSTFKPKLLVSLLEKAHEKTDPALSKFESKVARFLGRFGFPSKKHCGLILKKDETPTTPNESASFQWNSPKLGWLSGFP